MIEIDIEIPNKEEAVYLVLACSGNLSLNVAMRV